MAWKPKEKELTPEEAIAAAKKDLAPFWTGSSPLIAGVRNQGKALAYPLDKAFHEVPWLLFFLDPTEFSGLMTLQYAKEFYRRYQPNGLGMILIYRPTYPYMADGKFTERFVKNYQFSFPVVLDHDGLLHEAFTAQELPKVVLVEKGVTIFERAGKTWTRETEKLLQQFLRKTDPGLPLLTQYFPADSLPVDVMKFEFGGKKATPGIFGTSGFIKTNPPGTATLFKAERPKKMNPGELVISGSWIQNEDLIATEDPEAFIAFRSPGKIVSLIGQAFAKTSEPAKVVIEVDGIPAFDVFGGEDLQFDDEGNSFVKLERPSLYHPLSKLPEANREITLRFPFSKKVPVALFGIRFGD